ncbi:MAG: hypothetical protein KIS29_01565 [Thermoplasmata archaeon]|nr:hypothetical protein [Candidatus Sysuiplasma jiujiangense]
MTSKDENGGLPKIKYSFGVGLVVAGVVFSFNYFANSAIGFVKNSHFNSYCVAALSAMTVVVASAFLMLWGSALIARSVDSTLCDILKKRKERKKQ